MIAAKATHWAFYLLMFAIPLAGWLYVSTQWRGSAPLNVPTLWFGLFEVGHLFGLNDAATATREQMAGILLGTHVWLVWGSVVLLALHVGAGLKHHFINRDRVLGSMLPVVDRRPRERLPGEWRRRVALWSGSMAIAVAGITVVWAIMNDTPATAVTGGTASIADLPDSTWTVSPDSEIAFSGLHAGTPFTGQFGTWRIGIRFDPQDPAGSSMVVEVDTGSARDGDPLHEESLPGAEWFDVANHPTATFRSSSIRPIGANRFEVAGSLTLKDRELALPPLILSLEGEQLTIEGRVVLSRREANLGMESDPGADWVSDEIPVDVRVTASR